MTQSDMAAKDIDAGRSPWAKLIVLLWAVTALALLIVSFFWAGSGVRHTGDTWIGLAGGRLICERLAEGGLLDWHSRFPIEDEFTFTFAGRVWTNQNWLVHVIYWLIYKHWSPMGLVVWKLVLIALTGLALWRCAAVLSGNQAIAVLVTCAGLLCSREFVDIRPNHVLIVYVVTMFWLLLRVKYGKRWAVWLIPVLMTLWGNSHGSFLLGFVMMGAFVACEALQRAVARQAILASWRSLGWVCVAGVVSVILVLLISPYGWSNFTHPLVIMSGKDAEVFQGVMEWQPPYRNWDFVPRVHGFWILVGLSAVIWTAAAITSLLPSGTEARRERAAGPAVFDLSELALVGIGLYLAMSSRRFAPLFIVLSLPVTAKLLAATLRRAAGIGAAAAGSRAEWRFRWKVLVGIALLNAALAAFFASGGRGRRLLWTYYEKTDEPYATWLLKRHTHFDEDLGTIVEFANRHGVAGPVFNEWTYGGYLMFKAPQLKLYIDGRSQALFSADFYKGYWMLTRNPRPPRGSPAERGRRLDSRWEKLGLDLVLVKRTPPEVDRVINPLLATHNWQPLFETDHAILMVRGVSSNPVTEDLMRRYWAAELEWPDTTYGWRILGHIWQNGPWPDYNRAIDAFRRAIELGPQAWLYDSVLVSWKETGRIEEALAYYRAERKRIKNLFVRMKLDPIVAQKCVRTLDRIIASLEKPSS